jgi:gamma-glutamyltranspeptidase/glutathione hydrolase
LACSACGSVSDKLFGSSTPPAGAVGHVQGFLGGVVADEPRAALAGREVLSQGGTAADAAVAMGFTLAVTLPSRAGLGAGGACLAYGPDKKGPNAGVPEAVMFTPVPPAAAGTNADRPAAVPMLARGLFLLHARYGRRPFESLVIPAEQIARFGIPVSRALGQDLQVVAGPLLADPAAAAVFSRNGAVLKDGDSLLQPDLGGTLAQIRVSGVGDFYQGVLARRIADRSPLIGGPLTMEDLRTALPKLVAALIVPAHSDKVAFLPPPADGGLAAAAAFSTLLANPTDYGGAAARAMAAAARWRQGGITPEAVLASTSLPSAAPGALPASTSFAVLDRDGNAVVCAESMGNLFGTGRLLPGLGFGLAASPASTPPPLYAAGLAWNDHLNSFLAEAGGSGQAGAPMAVAVALTNAIKTGQAMAAPVPEPGRANVIVCRDYLPGENNNCRWAADPRGAGMAIGGN